jgi:iron complex transport system substrate-binding protein
VRIVSLIASSTEIVCALGFENDLVARSHECDFPESVRRLPAVTAPKFDVDGSSAEIDARVKTIVAEALSVYRVDADRLRELRPDVVVTQSQCEVCAVSLRDVEEAVRDWVGARPGERPPTIVSLQPNRLADVWDDVRRVAAALGAPERGDELVRRLRSRMEDVARRARAAAARPTIAAVEWIEPLMACGNWMPELVDMAGGVNLFGEAGKHSPWMTWDDVVAKDPDVLFVVPCGFDVDRTRRDMPALVGRPGWSDLRAVRRGRVVLADGNRYFNRPGPRLVESLEILAEALHPGEVDFGHRGVGWQPL